MRNVWLVALLPAAAFSAPPAYHLTDLGNVNWESLPWASPPPCNLNAQDPPSACSASKTLLVGAFRVPAPAIQHAAVIGTPSSGAFSSPVDLGVLPGGVWSAAHGVNNHNLIVGANGPIYPADRNSSFAVTWTIAPGGTPQAGPWMIRDLGNLMHSPYYDAGAQAVDDAGEIVGWSSLVQSDGSIVQTAALWLGSSVYRLQTLLQNAPAVTLRSAIWINCQGNIAAIGTPTAYPNAVHYYLLTRIGMARSCPVN